MKRRKFKPTHMERTVFGDAGGQSLMNVADVEGVGRVGALACWGEFISCLLADDDVRRGWKCIKSKNPWICHDETKSQRFGIAYRIEERI